MEFTNWPSCPHAGASPLPLPAAAGDEKQSGGYRASLRLQGRSFSVPIPQVGKTEARGEPECSKSVGRQQAGVQGIKDLAPRDHILLFVQWGSAQRPQVAIDRLGGMVKALIIHVEVAVL